MKRTVSPQPLWLEMSEGCPEPTSSLPSARLGPASMMGGTPENVKRRWGLLGGKGSILGRRAPGHRPGRCPEQAGPSEKPCPAPQGGGPQPFGWAAEAGGDQRTARSATGWRGTGPGLSAHPRPAPCHSTEDRAGALGRRALPCRCALWEGGMVTPWRRRGLPQGGVAGALGRKWGDQSPEEAHP